MSQKSSDTNKPERPAITVVVPIEGEAENVGPLTAEIANTLEGRWSFELIYVDDGSTDGTGKILADLMLARPWLRHVRHTSCCGQSAAIRTGVMAARGLIVVTLDGDGQNDPSFIPALVRALEHGAERVGLVAGQRVGRRSSLFKKIQSRIANSIRAAILRDGTRDTGCGLKAFRRDAFLELPYFDGIHRFLPALFRRDGYDIVYVDVVDRERRRGRSHYGMWNRLWSGILDIYGVWWLTRRRRIPRIGE
jgi:dolichol-phosphate mannosyltransferase